MNTFVWLASYPKSGNTWVRAFLSSVRQNGGPVDINRMDVTRQPSSRLVLDDILGLATADLTQAEILQARPTALASDAAYQQGPLFCKVHEAWLRTQAGLPLFPTHLTQASVYIARDPRDVAISFAHHLGISIDEAISLMANPDAAMGSTNSRLTLNTTQPLLTWSQHVTSWLDQASPSPLLVRYEDMLANPVHQGSLIAQHVGLGKDPSIYEQAVRHSSFGELSKQERSNGFAEARSPERRFFRSGTAGAWQKKLTPAQIATIEADHGATMARLGYR